MTQFLKQCALTAFALTLLSPIHGVNAQTAIENMPAGSYGIDKTHASLTWKVSHLGLSDYTARFTDFDATIELDPVSPANSKLTASVNPTSIKTDYPYPEKKDFDKKLVEGKEWFNAVEFPAIEFNSTSIELTSDTTGIVNGNLTFLGFTKPLALNVVFNGAMEKQPFSQKPTLGFSATATLKRSEWGMSTYVPNIGENVKLLIEAEFAKQDE